MDVMAEVGACCVAEVMGTELYTLTPDTVVASARRLAFDNGIDHLLVLENGTLAGIVCKDDLRFAARTALVSECMSSPVLCIAPGHDPARGRPDHDRAERLLPAGRDGHVPGRHGHARRAGHRRPRTGADANTCRRSARPAARSRRSAAIRAPSGIPLCAECLGRTSPNAFRRMAD